MAAWPKNKQHAIQVLREAAKNLAKAAEEYDDIILHTESLNIADVAKFIEDLP